jgi:hypothetical protein
MEKIHIFLLVVLFSVISFFLGKFSASQKNIEPTYKNTQPEISVIHLQERVGDSLVGNISGPARIVWNDSNTIETEGGFEIPLPQIPNESDVSLTSLPYTANAKTKKFYPSDSYPARGVEVKYRRLFDTKEAAIAAGFIPSKLVK